MAGELDVKGSAGAVALSDFQWARRVPMDPKKATFEAIGESTGVPALRFDYVKTNYAGATVNPRPSTTPSPKMSCSLPSGVFGKELGPVKALVDDAYTQVMKLPPRAGALGASAIMAGLQLKIETMLSGKDASHPQENAPTPASARWIVRGFHTLGKMLQYNNRTALAEECYTRAFLMARQWQLDDLMVKFLDEKMGVERDMGLFGELAKTTETMARVREKYLGPEDARVMWEKAASAYDNWLEDMTQGRVSSTKEFEEAFRGSAECWAKAGNSGMAFESFQELRALYPNSPQNAAAWFEFGKSLERHNFFENSIDAYCASIEAAVKTDSLGEMVKALDAWIDLRPTDRFSAIEFVRETIAKNKMVETRNPLTDNTDPIAKALSYEFEASYAASRGNRRGISILERNAARAWAEAGYTRLATGALGEGTLLQIDVFPDQIRWFLEKYYTDLLKIAESPADKVFALQQLALRFEKAGMHEIAAEFYGDAARICTEAKLTFWAEENLRLMAKSLQAATVKAATPSTPSQGAASAKAEGPVADSVAKSNEGVNLAKVREVSPKASGIFEGAGSFARFGIASILSDIFFKLGIASREARDASDFLFGAIVMYAARSNPYTALLSLAPTWATGNAGQAIAKEAGVEDESWQRIAGKLSGLLAFALTMRGVTEEAAKGVIGKLFRYAPILMAASASYSGGVSNDYYVYEALGALKSDKLRSIIDRARNNPLIKISWLSRYKRDDFVGESNEPGREFLTLYREYARALDAGSDEEILAPREYELELFLKRVGS